MAIIYQRDLPGPGTHALVIGISGYAAFPEPGPASASRSATMFATWMRQRFRNPSAPLASLDWVFLDVFQIARGQQLTGGTLGNLPDLTPAVVRSSVENWIRRLQDRPGSTGIFFFSGHGVSLGKDTALLLKDFQLQSGGSAISLRGVVDALSGIEANLLFLIDAGRAGYSGILDLWPPLPPTTGPGKARRAIVQATPPGRAAQVDENGTSVFAKALMASLEAYSSRGAPEALSPKRLIPLLNRSLAHEAARSGVKQTADAEIDRDFTFLDARTEGSDSPTDWEALALGPAMPEPIPYAVASKSEAVQTRSTEAGPGAAAASRQDGRSKQAARKHSGDSAAISEFGVPSEKVATSPKADSESAPSDPAPATESADSAGEEATVPALEGSDDAPAGPVPAGTDEEAVGDMPILDDGSLDGGPVEPARPAARDEANTEFVADDAETERDELARAVLAIGLARRLHRIWRNANEGPAAARVEEARAAFVVHLDAPWGGGKTTFANFLERVLDPLPAGRGPAAFLRQRYAGADVGGIFLEDPPADESAAKRLARLPVEVRRPWIIAPFNAWQVEHCSPPWWVFYQAIRKRCFDSILAQGDGPWDPAPERSRAERWGRRLDAWWLSKTRRLIAHLSRKADLAGAWRRRLVAAHDLKLRDKAGAAAVAWASWHAPLRRLDLWLDLWLREFRWRLGNPKVRSLLLTAASSLAVLVLLWVGGVVGPKADGGGMSYAAGGVGLLLGGLTGITGLWGLGALFTESIVPGTDTLAERLSLGSGDPFARFRRHFTLTVELVRRPVLVVVDDLDRCKPDFVVDIVRGMQTLLRSPRVVFVILGDRDWIERAFEAHHHAMSKVDVGPEQTFGARFVEKAIQMSFLLPAMEEDTRLAYVRKVLLGERAEAPVNAVPPIDAETAKTVRETVNRESDKAGSDPFDTEAMLEKALEEVAQRPGAALPPHAELKLQVKQEVNDTLAINATTSQAIESGVVHQLEALAPHFPPNPRQIKRIVNTVTIYYAVALQRRDVEPDADFRTQLALWVIIMTEWPETWRLIASFPELVGFVQSANVEQALMAPGVTLPGSPATVRKAVERILADPELKALIRGRTGPPLDRKLVPYLAQLTPLHSRKRRLDDDDDEPPEAPAARKAAKKTGGAR